jgi:CRISPR-associated endoribonuclease Cas6
MFEPSALAFGPSGLADWPRPFVFRASHLDARHVCPGEAFHFDVHLFDLSSPALAYLVLAFAQLGREGLGPRRARVELTGVWQLDERRQPATAVYDGWTPERTLASPLEIDLAPADGGNGAPVRRVRVRFLTPTEIKTGHEIAARPEFPILAARIRDRVSALRAFYGAGPLDIDFRAFGERAGGIRMTRCDVRHADIVRRSSRTGQTHPLGGFVGDAEYEGDLTEFVPYLRAAQWTGVGRQTVWGKGEIAVECF